MSKSFLDAFEEWKSDKRYQIGEDCGTEESENSCLDPTSSKSSLTPENHGDKDST